MDITVARSKRVPVVTPSELVPRRLENLTQTIHVVWTQDWQTLNAVC